MRPPGAILAPGETIVATGNNLFVYSVSICINIFIFRFNLLTSFKTKFYGKVYFVGFNF